MKATAKHWVKYHGEWHGIGDTFEIEAKDAEEMKRYADLSDEADRAPEADEPAQSEEPVRRGRKKKTEE